MRRRDGERYRWQTLIPGTSCFCVPGDYLILGQCATLDSGNYNDVCVLRDGGEVNTSQKGSLVWF